MQQRVVDSHIHIWNLSRAQYDWLKVSATQLNRTYELKELEQERKKAGITDGVLIQAANNFEDTDYMLEVAASSDWIRGVVGWLPLMDPHRVEKALTGKYNSNNYFRGVRHLIHDERDPKWLLNEKVIESLNILANRKLPYDVVGVLPAHIETAINVARKVHSLRMVFDHLNQPPIATDEKFGEWGELLKEASANKNFFVKISGLGTTSQKKDWSKKDIQPFIEFALEHFGVDRCFCGGDWPVSLLAGSYGQTWNIYREVLDNLLNEADRAKVYYENAKAFYKLDEAL
jgi:L-fuconolactonase